MDQAMQYIWPIAAFALLITELLSMTFWLVCVAIGCFVAWFVCMLGGGITAQLICAGVACLGSVFVFLPRLKQRFKRLSAKEQATGMDALIGRIGVVVEAFSAEGAGRVKIDGDCWMARCETPGVELAEGDRVTVESFDSIVLTVSKV